jgi:hypothetical protein
MRPTAWSFYDPNTGRLTGRTFTGLEDHLAVNTPAGYVAVKGVHDALSKRIDLETGAVIDYQPPQPDADHEWDVGTRRWRRRADVVEREWRRERAGAQIADLERRQLRPMRELQLNPDNVEARTRLEQIEAQIVALRSVINAETDTTAP